MKVLPLTPDQTTLYYLTEKSAFTNYALQISLEMCVDAICSLADLILFYPRERSTSESSLPLSLHENLMRC